MSMLDRMYYVQAIFFRVEIFLMWRTCYLSRNNWALQHLGKVKHKISIQCYKIMSLLGKE